MMKWYDEIGRDSDVIIASRIRLLRNLRDYKFPVMLSDEEEIKLSEMIEEKVKEASSLIDQEFDCRRLADFSEAQRGALRERQVINRAVAEEPAESRLMLSKDESVSITINGKDHFRLQICSSGLDLTSIWDRISQLDDFINERFAYAFDDKYGYMTTYPTNVGTGMRVYLILHLPLLDSTSKFAEMQQEISRYGISMKPAFGKESENNGNLYVLYNQKTLGVTEQEIIQVITKVAGQLASQERSIRSHSVKSHYLQAEDICYKAYGSLKYARLLTLPTAMHLLSQLCWGQEEGVISFDGHYNFYKIMTGVQPFSLSTYQNKVLSGEAQDAIRAEYIRTSLPELQEVMHKE